MCYIEIMEIDNRTQCQRFVCSEVEHVNAHNNFCDTMMVASQNRGNGIITPEEYDMILLNADAEYNRIVYGE